MEDLTFLRDVVDGKADIIIDHEGYKCRVIGLDLDLMWMKMPKLAALFESTDHGDVCVLDKFPRRAVISLLRYIYLDDYRMLETRIDEQCSLLPHVQMYYAGELYCAPELTRLASTHILRELELTSSIGRVPLDLCDAIRFVYNRLAHAMQIKNNIVNVCISCCRYYNLSAHDDFCEVLRDIPAFYQDFSVANMFESEAASDIMQLLTPHVQHDFEAGPHVGEINRSSNDHEAFSYINLSEVCHEIEESFFVQEIVCELNASKAYQTYDDDMDFASGPASVYHHPGTACQAQYNNLWGRKAIPDRTVIAPTISGISKMVDAADEAAQYAATNRKRRAEKPKTKPTIRWANWDHIPQSAPAYKDMWGKRAVPDRALVAPKVSEITKMREAAAHDESVRLSRAAVGEAQGANH